MLFLICEHKHPYKDRASIQLLLRDKYRVFNKDNELERSPPPLGLPADLAKPEANSSTNLVIKSSEQDL